MPKKPACPNCGISVAVVPIAYGHHAPEMAREAEQDKIVPGGCIGSNDSLDWYCKTCRLSFDAVTHPVRPPEVG